MEAKNWKILKPLRNAYDPIESVKRLCILKIQLHTYMCANTHTQQQDQLNNPAPHTHTCVVLALDQRMGNESIRKSNTPEDPSDNSGWVCFLL